MNNESEKKEASSKASQEIILTEKGLYLSNQQITSPIQLLYLSRNEDSKNWSKVFLVVDPDDKKHEVFISNEDLMREPIGALANLVKNGFKIFNSSNRNQIISFLNRWDSHDRRVTINRTGWYQDSFVTTDEVFGPKKNEILFDSTLPTNYKLETKGSLEKWKEDVAAYTKGNPKLIASLCLSISGPFLSIFNQSNFGLHLFGPSSCGKTLAAGIAASVWSRANGSGSFIQTWRNTANALEGIAFAHNHMILILDELGELEPSDLGKSIYLLGNGMGKGRSNQIGEAQSRKFFQTVFLSTGEETIESILSKTHVRVHAGQEIRFIEIDSDSHNGLGIFNCTHQFVSSKQLADKIFSGIKNEYGSAGEELLKRIVERVPIEKQSWLLEFETTKNKFKNAFCENANSQVNRVADSFSFLVTCGEIASRLKVLPYTKDECFQSLGECFKIWLNYTDRSNLGDDSRLLKNVRIFFEKYGVSRFGRIGNQNNESAAFPPQIEDEKTQAWQQAGYRGDYHGQPCWFVFPEVFKSEILQGFDTKRGRTILQKNGFLIPSSESTYHTKKFGTKSRKVYIVKETILE